ncbi:MAG: hypothetical protein NC206_08270 [Bacteroides sp.]|nr:hypothetical protein [Roseburia sp.]MCM1347063.1 hypothetical protein [Bacteroides sp.]MCM1420648.1 hypothetical protein [Bacteroides sp.]
MNYRKMLSRRISFDDMMEMLFMMQEGGYEEKEKFYRFIFDEDEKVARNALLTLNKFTLSENEWLYTRHHELINESMSTSDDTKRRLLLSLLNRQPFSKSDMRTDFFDFCMKHAMMVSEPVAVKVLCLKLAYVMSVHFKELQTELRYELENMPEEMLVPSVRTCRKNLLKKLGL